MKISLTKREWDAVLYALDLWIDSDEKATPFERVGKRAQGRILDARHAKIQNSRPTPKATP